MLRHAISVLVLLLTFGVRAAPSSPAPDDPADAGEVHAPLATVAQAGEPQRPSRPGLGLAVIASAPRIAVTRAVAIEETPAAPAIVTRGPSLADRARAPPARA